MLFAFAPVVDRTTFEVMRNVDHEIWLLEAGDNVIQKKAEHGESSLTLEERLTYCLWVADYGMRNAGDLDTAADVHPSFLKDGKSVAKKLGFPRATAAFSLSAKALEREYFGRFDELIAELRASGQESK